MTSLKPEVPTRMEHVTVYRNESEFSSWPFNAGMWKIADDNVLVAFMNIRCDYTIPLNLKHNRVETFGRIAAVRSADGGQTWSRAADIADNIEVADLLKHGREEAYREPFDFADPNVLLSCWTTPSSGDPAAKAWIKMSADGGASWGPAVRLPECSIPRFQGRPSYVVRPDGVILLFLTARPTANPYDRPVVYSSSDGGCTWALMSYMPASGEYRMICPSPVVLPDGTIVVAVRCKPSMEAAWDEIYASNDGGWSWRFVSRVNDHGDTAHLTRLKDGRLFIVYGYRRPPYGIRARISEDAGNTWGPEMVLRDDGGSRDLGYPRAVELDGGRILATYYFNDRHDPIQMNGGVRYIAGTILEV